MADEDITLDGKPLHSLRVADLKAALEQRSLPKSGQKNTLIKRLKGALMLENLQRSSSSHSMLQPNSQIGEEMCQNSFIKQYLAKQQELLRQRLEREAQKEDDTDESPAGPEEDEDHSEDNDSFASDKHRTLPSQSSVPGVRGEPMMGCGPGSAFHHQESPEAPGVRMQRAGFQQGHREPPAPSPPRAVASLSVRVLGQPDSQGFPAAAPRPQEKEPAMHSQPGSAHPVLNLSRSARSSAGNHIQDDSDDDDDDDDDSDDDEDWGPGLGKAGERKRALPALPQMAPSISSAAAVRSKRKLQPPQHIPPPPQVDPSPMQLRHPTPPPSPPPNLFPLPDTPKQSPPDDQERDAQVVSFQLPVMQRQDSDSSSRSSSPEPPVKRRPGPLSLLVHKMETEEASSAPGLSGETAHSSAGCSSVSLLHGSETKRQESRELEDRRQMKLEKEREQQEVERERRKAQQQEKEEKRLEQEKEKERARLEEEKRQLQEEEQEKEKRRQEEEKEKKHKEEEKRKDQERLKEEKAKKDKAKQDRMVVAEAQDSGSSSDSDSKSDSSRSSHSTSSSSSSSSSSRDKVQTTNQQKKPDQEAEDEKKTSLGKGSEKQNLSKREVSEPSTAAVTEVEPDSESSMAQQPASGSEPESNESRLEESTTPKAFAARRISLTGSKASPARTDGGSGELEAGNAGGRKRRWGSSTAVTVKKPSISITTDSLKSLIPDIKVNQEAVVDLHPEELQLSGDEENLDSSRGDPDKDLRIRRTVTQVVPSDSQENGQTNEEEEEEEEGEEEAAEEVEKMEREKQPKEKLASRDKRKSSLSDEASETQISVSLDGEAKKVTPSDSLVRRSISQQKSGVSVTVEDPVRTNRQSSPPRGKVSNIIHVTNLVRPFTLLQLKELLNRTGSVVEEGFWIDKIKSHCFVTYATTEEAVATRTALHGVKWPSSNPKVLSVDFSEQDELDFHKGILKPKKEEDPVVQPVVPQNRLPPLMPERDREKDHNRDRDKERERDRERDRDRGVRDLWAERQREMERRERARGEREWDRDKVREFARPGEDERRSRSRDRDRERKRRERAKSKEKKSEKKEKGDEPPAKLLDDLFLKTKAAPCIYWLPLTEEQATQRVLDRIERQKERERRRKEQEEETKKREEEKKEKPKGREKDGSAPASAGAAGRGADGTRERDRGRDGDKRKESSHRSKRTSPGAGSGRRSRSRSNQRERRR